MKTQNLNWQKIVENEVTFVQSRSQGPGGQNVNKVNSKVTLQWLVATSSAFSPEEKVRIQQKLKRYFYQSGEMHLHAQTSRSAVENKEKVKKKFFHLLSQALTPDKKRVATKPTKASLKKRADTKRKTAEKKRQRTWNLTREG